LIRECHAARSQEVAAAAAAAHAQEECKAAERRGFRLEGELKAASTSIEALHAMVHGLEAEVCPDS
jgi:L-amino acid N-acyltransferase YncA